MCETGSCNDCLRNAEVKQGLPGLDGIDGLSVLSGLTAPDDTLGVDGDHYVVNVSPFNFYYKSGGVWNFLGQLRGIDGNGFMVQSSKTLSAAEVLGSHSTPVALLPAIPSTVCVIPISAVGKLIFNTTAFTFPTNYELHLVYETTNADIGSFYNAFLLASSTQIWRANLVGFGSYQIPVGKNVMARVNYSGSFSGDSTVKIDLVYYIYIP